MFFLLKMIWRPLTVILLVATAWLSAALIHYYNSASNYRQQRDQISTELAAAKNAAAELATRQQQVSELDEKHTRELASAKKTIDSLRSDVAAGRVRLRVQATCPGVRSATAAPGVDNAASAEITADAGQDYLTLREQISTVTEQLTAAQEYIRQQCQNR